MAVDDYGLHPGINQAALLLAAAGRVQAIGCMVGGPAWLPWSRALADAARNPSGRHRIDLGLHLDLTETPSTAFAARPLWHLWLQCGLRHIDRPQLRAEIRRQFDAFEQAMGRPPDYVDGHQHVHQLPVVRTELLTELCRRHLQGRIWLRSTRRPIGRGLPFGFKSRVIEALGAHRLAEAAQRSGFSQNRALLGVYDFSADGPAHAAHLRQWLAAAQTGDLLICHPSLAFNGPDPIIEARMVEYDVLSGASFDGWLADAGVVLRPMSQILATAVVNDPG